MKKFIFFSLVVVLAVVLFGALVFLEEPRVQNELKPQITTTVTQRKFNKPATGSVAFVKIEETVASTKSVPQGNILITDKGNDLLVLINKTIRLPSNYVPSDLVSLSGLVETSGGFLRNEAALALKEMFDAAKSEGLSLVAKSPYRSYSQQQAVFNNWVASAGLKLAESFSARPGHSQHQLGTAVDVGAVGVNHLTETFASTKEGVWLTANGPKFGYVISYPKGKESVTGYSFEPWHYRYIGKDNAQRMLDSGLILEVFLQKYGVW